MSPSLDSKLAKEIYEGALNALADQGEAIAEEYKPRLIAIATNLAQLYTRQLAGEDVTELLAVTKASLANIEAAAGITAGRALRDSMLTVVSTIAKVLIATL